MLPDKIEHCIVFMNYWDVSGVFWSFSKCKIKIPHLPADPSSARCMRGGRRCGSRLEHASAALRALLELLVMRCRKDAQVGHAYLT